MKLLDALLFQK